MKPSKTTAPKADSSDTEKTAKSGRPKTSSPSDHDVKLRIAPDMYAFLAHYATLRGSTMPVLLISALGEFCVRHENERNRLQGIADKLAATLQGKAAKIDKPTTEA